MTGSIFVVFLSELTYPIPTQLLGVVQSFVSEGRGFGSIVPGNLTVNKLRMSFEINKFFYTKMNMIYIGSKIEPIVGR